MNIKDNVRKILKEIPKDVALVAASKAQPAEKIIEAIDSGIRIIGENYVQEAEEKFKAISETGRKVEWHFIGHLQKNKVKNALKIFDMIQTVDSIELGEEISKRAERKIPVLIEVNIADEPTKFGINADELFKTAIKISKLENIEIQGLMCMPFSEDENALRGYFRQMKKYFEQLKQMKILNTNFRFLSMGMSSDYKIAIEEGSNMVRLGTKIFEERKKE